MSYFVVYVLDDDGTTQDGEQIATGKGWLSWGDYVLDRLDEYPECAHLAQEGWLPAVDLDSAEHELEQLTHADDKNVAAISGGLLAAFKARPPETDSLMVSDGTEPQDTDEEDED